MYAEQHKKLVGFRDHLAEADEERVRSRFQRLIAEMRTYSTGWVCLEFDVRRSPEGFVIENERYVHLASGEWPDPDREAREVAVMAPCTWDVSVHDLRRRILGQVENKSEVVRHRVMKVETLKERGATSKLPPEMA